MDDFAFTAQQVLDKRAFIDSALREPAFDSFELRDVRVRPHGGTAAVTLVADLHGATLAVTDTWVNDGGHWRLLARQERRLEH